MKERPIIMTADSVRAILDGRTTQTRRVVTERYLPLVKKVLEINGKWVFDTLDYELTTPYGVPGDRLWVRESHVIQLEPCADYPSGDVVYKADYPDEATFDYEGGGSALRPSIFMPRWASRITLEILNVRVERVQEIDSQDVFKEGIKAFGGAQTFQSAQAWDPIDEYAKLWDALNAKRGYPWADNPWVFVIEFRRLDA